MTRHRIETWFMCAALGVYLASFSPAMAAEQKIGDGDGAPQIAQAPAPQPNDAAPGATVESLLRLARELNPELAAMALESTAAAARSESAGAWDNPIFRVTSDEVDRTEGGRINKMIYAIEQEFPLWGKRDLRRAIALAEADQVRGRERTVASELAERIKVAFARYYAVSQILRISDDVARVRERMARLAATRYAQGIGSQQDVYRTELEQTRFLTEVARLEADRRATEARINALLACAPGSTLAEPVSLRAMPAAERLHIETLVERARSTNPVLFAGAAEISAAEAGRKLVERSLYPDPTISVGGIDRANGPPGYVAMLGFRLPLQWGVKEALAREAAAKAGAAQSRLRAAGAQIQGGLEEALAALMAARDVEGLVRNRLLPQTEAAHRSAIAGYELGKVDLTTVFELEHQLHQARIDRLKAQEEQQQALAAIERLIGGDL